MRSPLATLIIVWAISTPLTAQWLKEPTRNMPRTADGMPDLLAPAPRASDGKPDLSGVGGKDPQPSKATSKACGSDRVHRPTMTLQV